MKGKKLGDIPCPYCADDMTVKTDKNGKPFGHCGGCQGQLRVGGNAAREQKFAIKYPVIRQALAEIYGESENPKPIINAAPSAHPVTEGKKPEKPVTDTGKKTGGFTMFD